jgi:hypothetical protein
VARYKKWEDHSPRWQREQTRKGLDKKRWNNWLKLSAKTQKQSDPIKYASGKSISDQRRERKEREAVKRIKAVTFDSRTSVVVRNVSRMSDADLDWTLKASPKQIKAKAGDKALKGRYGGVNPWWYR